MQYLKKLYASSQSQRNKVSIHFDNCSIFRVGKMCEFFAINRSDYYAWLKRPPSDRKIEDNVLSLEIKRISKESYGTYGARRIKEQLKKMAFNVVKLEFQD